MPLSALLTPGDVYVPGDVPPRARDVYIQNWLRFTFRTGRVHLFAGDQKIEHLNDDFHGEGIHPDDADPEHLFRIAARAKVSCLAVQLGYAARYARDYPGVPILVKLNSKSHLVKTKQAEPISTSFTDIRAVGKARDYGMNVVGVGYTIYLGSTQEAAMMAEAARLVNQAHELGLVTVLWLYPRGAAVPVEKDPHLIAGAAGVAMCLGTDVVKVNYCQAGPNATQETSFKEAVAAAGRTRVITAGGSAIDAAKFFDQLHKQLHVSGAAGAATGRNIHQRGLDEAVRFSDAMASMIFGLRDVAFAMKVYEGKEVFRPE
ncbi:MAG: aldolase [Planctomycetes bacterium]|nr:aldolase [Planctomycetota bacterium]